MIPIDKRRAARLLTGAGGTGSRRPGDTGLRTHSNTKPVADEIPLAWLTEVPAPDLTGHAIPLRLEYRLPPNSPLCDGDAKRLSHADLTKMGRAELELEMGRVKMALMFGDFRKSPPWAREWLQERLERCKRLVAERRKEGR